jgi:hypothetical protein
MRGRRGRDRMVVGLTATYAISAYHHWCCEFVSRSGRGVQHCVIKFVTDLRQVGGFIRVIRFPLPIKLPATIWRKSCWKCCPQILKWFQRVLFNIIWLFVLFLLAIVIPGLLQFVVSGYPFGCLNLILPQKHKRKGNKNKTKST